MTVLEKCIAARGRAPISKPVLMQVFAAREKQKERCVCKCASAFQRASYATGATQPAHCQPYTDDSHTLSARALRCIFYAAVFAQECRRSRHDVIALCKLPVHPDNQLLSAVLGLDSCLVAKSAPKVSPPTSLRNQNHGR